MKKTLSMLLIAGLLAGCGGGDEDEDENPLIVYCDACEEEISRLAEQCHCGHPNKWAKWFAQPDPYGGIEVLNSILLVTKTHRYGKLCDLNRKQISDISPLAGLKKKMGLSLWRNEISDISPLAGFTKLKHLDLALNQITDITPLAGLTKLEKLMLWENQITDVTPLAGLTNLEQLFLHGNQITDLSPLKGLTKLCWLTLGGNPIPEDQKEMIKKALPDCRIEF